MAKDNRWTYLGLSYEEELKARAFEEQTPAEKEKQIEEARAAQLHWGICQRCKKKILAYGREWPKVCPHCGYGEHS